MLTWRLEVKFFSQRVESGRGRSQIPTVRSPWTLLCPRRHHPSTRLADLTAHRSYLISSIADCFLVRQTHTPASNRALGFIIIPAACRICSRSMPLPSTISSQLTAFSRCKLSKACRMFIDKVAIKDLAWTALCFSIFFMMPFKARYLPSLALVETNR